MGDFRQKACPQPNRVWRCYSSSDRKINHCGYLEDQPHKIVVSKTIKYPSPVLLCLDFQNDLLHPQGVFPNNGISPAPIDVVIEATAKTMLACKTHQIPIIGAHLTVLTDNQGMGIGLGLFEKRFPFLKHQGFRFGTWGHAFVQALPPTDYAIRKWTFSALYHTELEHLLFALEAKTLILTGYSTNGVVEATARNLAERGFELVTLSDCTIAKGESYDAALNTLRILGNVTTSAEFFN